MNQSTNPALAALIESMNKAPINGKGQYMKAGRFVVRIKSFRVKDGAKGKSCINEFEIVASSNSEVEVGATYSQVISLEPKPGRPKAVEQACGDIKAALMAIALKRDPKLVKDPPGDAEVHNSATELFCAVLDPAFAASKSYPDNFLAGQLANLECQVTQTKTPPIHDWTLHIWTPYVAPTAAP